MKRAFPALLLLVSATAAFAQQAEPPTAPVIGPAHGTLLIIGGGNNDMELRKRFVALAGGPEANIVVIPTAQEGNDPAYWAEDMLDLQNAGARHLKVLHTRDRKVADSEEFTAPLREASGVFFVGGRQWRLADAYLNTRVQKELGGILERGGILAGTSAGATIMGSYLVRGDTSGNTVIIGDHTEGMGFLKNVAIDQHLLKRNRQFDMVAVIEKHPELLGIGIDEDTAILVRRDSFQVLGASYVVIYDHNRKLDSGGPFYMLTAGDHFNLKTREAERPEPKGAPIERVVKEPWKK
jgi:cyanophycinase